MNEQDNLSSPSDEEVTVRRRSKDSKRLSRISSDDDVDEELEHAGPSMDNVDNYCLSEEDNILSTCDEEVIVKRCSKGHSKHLSRISSDDDQELENPDPLMDNVDNGGDHKNQSSPSEEALTRYSKDSAHKITLIISSDDDEDLEDADADKATPSLALLKHNKRRKSSCEKFRRQLMLDKYKAKREECQAKKKLHLNGHESDMNHEYDSSLHEYMDEEDFPSAESGAEDEPKFEHFHPTGVPLKRHDPVPEDPMPISSSSEEDLSTPKSKDGSSQDMEEEEDPNLDGFIVPDSQCSSQDVDWQENANLSVEDFLHFWKPTDKEAFEIFLQGLLIKLLLEDDCSLGCLEPILRENPILVAAERKVEDILESKKSLLSSTRWDRKFTDELKKNTVLRHEELPLFKGKCQACRFSRDITRKISLQDDNGETVVEFCVGRFCAGRAIIYQEIHHFCDVELKKSCQEKILDLKEVVLAHRGRPVIESVEGYCEREKRWMNKLFHDYKELLNKADEWATEGSHYRRMQSTVFSYS